MDIYKPLNAQVLETNWQLFTESRLVSFVGILLIGLYITILILASWTFTKESNPSFTVVTATEVLAYIATILALLYFFVATQTWASQNIKGPYFWTLLFLIASIVLLVSSAALRSRVGSTQVSGPTPSGSTRVPAAQVNAPPGSTGSNYATFINLSFALSIVLVAILVLLLAWQQRPILLALENVPRTLGLS